MKRTKDILIELGIFQNVVEIDSMNYGWDVTKGSIRSRHRFVGDVEDPGLVFSERNIYHTKFSVKRLGLDAPDGFEYPWGLVFGATKRQSEDLIYDLHMVLAKQPSPDPEPFVTEYQPMGNSDVEVVTHDPKIQTASSVLLKGELTKLDVPEADVLFRYSKYEKETWWILADTHVGFHGDFSASDLNLAVDDALDLGLSDFAIVLGDIVENSVDGVEPFEKAMNRLPHPWTYILGNHDVDGWWWDPPETAPLVMPPEYGYKIVGGIRFIWLSDEGDGNWDYDGGYARKMYISDEQNDWFKGLMDSDTEIPTIILTHQGPCVTGDWADDIPDFWDLEERAWLKEDLEDYNLLAWIHGHRHIWFFHPDFEGLDFTRISVDSIDKNTVTNESMFMEIERYGDKTTLTFSFRDHAEKEWRTLYGEYELTIDVEEGHIDGWQETDPITMSETGEFSELLEVEPGASYRVAAIARWNEEEYIGNEVHIDMHMYDLLLAHISYDVEERSMDIEEIYDMAAMDDLSWGMILERIGKRIKVYAQPEGDGSPTDCVLDHVFEEKLWDKNVFGIFGYECEVHTALGYARYCTQARGDFEDYSIYWNEDGIHSGSVKMKRDPMLAEYLQGGAYAFIHSRPFGKEISGNDLYGKRTPALTGYVADIMDHDNYLELDLDGVTKDLDRREEVVLLKDLDLTVPATEGIKVLDAFTVLKYIFDHAVRLNMFNHPTMSHKWHDENDSVFVVNGNLLNATVRYSYFLNMILSPMRVQEGVFTDVNVFKPESGETLELRSGEAVTKALENLVHDIKLEKKTGVGEYINKLRGYAYLAEEGIEWSPLRTARLKRLLGQELITVEEDTLRFAQFVGSKEKFSDVIEGYILKQDYDWSGEIEIHGHHHYLGGYLPQGVVDIIHPRTQTSKTFRVQGFELQPYKTILHLTNKPRRRTEPAGSEFERVWDYMMAKNIFTALGKTVFEAYEDSLQPFDTENIVEAKLIGEDDLEITDWVEIHESSFLGYKFIDAKFDQDDFIGASEHLNAAAISLKNIFGSVFSYEFNNFYKHGIWCLDPEPLGPEGPSYQFRIFGNLGLLEDAYKYEIKDGFIVLGPLSGGFGEPGIGGGILGDPRGDEYLE